MDGGQTAWHQPKSDAGAIHSSRAERQQHPGTWLAHMQLGMYGMIWHLACCSPGACRPSVHRFVLAGQRQLRAAVQAAAGSDPADLQRGQGVPRQGDRPVSVGRGRGPDRRRGTPVQPDLLVLVVLLFRVLLALCLRTHAKRRFLSRWGHAQPERGHQTVLSLAQADQGVWIPPGVQTVERHIHRCATWATVRAVQLVVVSLSPSGMGSSIKPQLAGCLGEGGLGAPPAGTAT